MMYRAFPEGDRRAKANRCMNDGQDRDTIANSERLLSHLYTQTWTYTVTEQTVKIQIGLFVIQAFLTGRNNRIG